MPLRGQNGCELLKRSPRGCRCRKSRLCAVAAGDTTSTTGGSYSSNRSPSLAAIREATTYPGDRGGMRTPSSVRAGVRIDNLPDHCSL